MLVDFGRAGWLSKAQQQPEKVREVLEKARTDGLAATFEAVRSKLDEPMALGYSNVGQVEAVGAGVKGFEVGDRVVSNGPHAEMASVPQNLCARVPAAVCDDAAAFTVVGAIGLQGVRLGEPTLGECFVVTGLGLVGLMTVQLLRSNGCRVLGIDPDPAKTAMARRFGAETVELAEGEGPLERADGFSRGRGVDGVLLTLSAKENRPVSDAARMCRKRGRIVLVGVTGLELDRSLFYEKELTFQVSCSYGPGRYDSAYEEGGQDYPVGFVRWTEQRNFEAVLDLMAAGQLDVEPLVTHRFAIEQAPSAYDLLSNGQESYLGILLDYEPKNTDDARTVQLGSERAAQVNAAPQGQAAKGVFAVLGAGNHAGRVLLPAFHDAGGQLAVIANSGSPSGVHYGRKFGVDRATTDVDSVFEDTAVDSVVIATRHNSHARYVVQALGAGKNVYCEKPLALTHEELAEVDSAYSAASSGDAAIPVLTVGFNRRFAPLVRRMKGLLDGLQSPKSFVMTVNAGAVPADHWTQDPAIGGGRIVGEACHFVDLLRHLAGCRIERADVVSMAGAEGVATPDDKATITLQFADGSFGSVHYLANGHKSVPKERLEVFGGGRVMQLENFRRLTLHGWGGRRGKRLLRQDKGQKACPAAFVEAVRQGGPAPIPVDEAFEVSRVSIDLAEAARG
jgi:predicted dehydrogenase/threonine dehydrogenase-like Zn-dependent dehydrogenase